MQRLQDQLNSPSQALSAAQPVAAQAVDTKP